MKIIIPGNAIAKKNSMRIIKMGRRSSIRSSVAYDKWAARALQELMLQRVPKYTGSYPVEMQIFFYRKTRAKFDFSNLLEGSQDVLQQAGIIDDDSMNHLIPVIDRRGKNVGWDVDKHNPRTEIFIKHIYLIK